jgi:hypothetical protein
MVYELPFGKNKKHIQSGVGAAVLGGWQVSTLFRYSSGIPFFFRLTGSACNVPSQFRAGCIPAIKGGANVFAQDKGGFDPAKGPLLNKDAFESVGAFNFGRGDRVTDVRGFGYHNQDLSLIKNTKLGNGINLQLRIEAFNLWNWHIFQAQGNVNYGLTAFNTDLASPDFGKWNGTVSDPRNVQVAARIEF